MLNLKLISIDLQNDSSKLSIISKKLIRKFYNEIISSDSKNFELMRLWKDEFEFIYGKIDDNLSSNRKIKPDELSRFYDIYISKPEDLQVVDLFMSIQTYLSLLVRIMTYKLIRSVKNDNSDNLQFKVLLTEIINGSYFKKNGIENFCYEDWYSWILNAWDEDLEIMLKELVLELEVYDHINGVDNFINFHNNDYVKQIYETVIPKELRHALGEYYTPDWLAQYTIEQSLSLGTKHFTNTRFLDPTCGSGTFLFKLLQEIKKETTSVSELTNNVFGFDINPLAVLTSKTNYLISIIDILEKESTTIHLPIYNYDVINSPIERNGFLEIDINNNFIYKIPIGWVEKKTYKNYLYKLSDESYSQNNFDYKLLYDQINSHSPRVKNILINMIINRIEGYLVDKVDIIIGNPPWVNWEYLPEDYRKKSAHLWKDYGIFSVKGRDLSFSKEDISVLITYLVIDKYLVSNGYLGFVIRQGLFKSAQNGVGFRKFKVRDNGYNIKVLRVDDLSNIKPFENVSNSTAVMFIQKNQKHEYPVPYYMWEKKRATKSYTLDSYAELDKIISQIEISPMIAIPAIKDDITSMWITAKKDALDAIKNVLGTNNYRARTGVFTGGANAVYWMQIQDKTHDGNIIISNITHRAKRKVKNVKCKIEKDLIYPLVQGSDISMWNVNTKAYILCPHTCTTKMKPIEEDIIKNEYPLTYEYLHQFKESLDNRKGFAGWEKQMQKENFHSILRIGEYTFSKYKVAWRYIATEFITAVISYIEDDYLGKKLMMPNEKIMYVSTDKEEEAYYLCGVLSSDPIAFSVKSYMNPTSISTHVLEKLKIPTFDESNVKHQEISRLCKEGHQTDNTETKNELLSEINTLVADIYNIDKSKMKVLSEALRS